MKFLLGVPTPTRAQTWEEVWQRYFVRGTLGQWYKFNETSGTTIFNHGTVGAALDALWIPGAGGALGATGLLGAGHAVNLDGAESVIQMPQHAYFNSPASTQVFLMKMRTSGEAGEGYLFQAVRGPVATTFFKTTLAEIRSVADTDAVDGDATTITTAGIDANWVVLFRTYDDAGDRKVHLYVGNAAGLVELPTSTQTAAIGTLRPINADVFLGGNSATPSRGCNGLMDEYVGLNVVLSLPEMLEVVSTLPF
jgi:hypothetical protein